MVPTKIYRVAVIGRTGRGNYGHGIDVAWKTHPRAQVVGVADDNAAGLRAAGERLGAKTLFADYKQMLRETRPDIVAVCPRWLDAHLDMVLAAAEVRASMFMEKPMARTLAECDQMIDACDRVHARLSVAHNMRNCPVLDLVYRKVREGIIGELQEIRGRGKEDRRAGGEDMMVLGTHVFDLMRRFAGDPKWVTSRICIGAREATRDDVNPNGPEGMGPILGDNIQAMFGFAGGITGHFASKRSTEESGRRFGVDLYGSRGILSIRAAHVPEVWVSRSVRWTGDNWERLEFGPGIRPRDQNDAYHLMIDDLLDAIENHREPDSGARNGRWTLEMVMGVYASHRLGARVPLPLAKREHPLAG